MEDCIMQVELTDIRAIQKANIALNGITVIAGENGCGKSTLSRLLYHTILTLTDFEEIVRAELMVNLRDEINFLGDLLREIEIVKDLPLNGSQLKREFNKLDISEIENKLYLYIDIIQEYLVNNLEKQNYLLFGTSGEVRNKLNEEYKLRRFLKILRNLMGGDDNIELSFDTVAQALEELKKHITKKFSDAYEIIQNRDVFVYTDYILNVFNGNVKGKINLQEYNVPIIDWLGGKLETIHWIKDCIYIDTPMAINDPYSSDIYWRDLINALRKKNVMTSGIIDQLEVINKVISGEVYYNQDVLEEGFKFKRSDGKVFELQECATGIKSFGIIQVLLRNGILNKDTLLIVDEPEAHLHPQWIVEYARLIVLLNKYVGIKFLIASHNPDMVSALKYISEKEGINGKLNFYLATKVKNEFIYSYKNLGTDIEEIFASFNIALERINQYGIIENEIL